MDYSKGIESIVKKRIKQGYGYLATLRTIYGADPREVWDSFNKCHKSESEQEILIEKLNPVNNHPELPESHQIYSQWRITKKSLDLLAGKLAEKHYDKVCFLGFPTLGLRFGKMNPGKSFILDIDSAMMDYAKQFAEVMVYDANDEVPQNLREKFDCVITDPPWYYNEIVRFIKRSSDLVKKAGTIHISLPEILTRPSIPDERIDMQRWLSDNNLIISGMSPTAEYEVPFFEFMTYKDIPFFTGETWRRGDWLKLKKMGESGPISAASKAEKWHEYSHGCKRIFLREKGDDNGQIKLSTLYDDGSLVLKTVSRRSPLIPKIDIWSSRNAVLHIDSGYSKVKEMLDKGDYDPSLLKNIIEI